MIENKDDILKYQIKPKVDTVYGNSTTLLKPPPVEFYEYVIITNSTLKPYFDDFVNWKKRKGLNIGVVTTASIYYEYTGDLISGIYDNAGEIRSYLRDLYECGGTWVLLAGDYTVVPVRHGCGWNDESWSRWVEGDYRIPTDNYFADRNGDWQVDGDEWIGQPDDDNPDYQPELFVGRLLCSTGQEIQNWTQKLLRYEQDPGNGDLNYLTHSFMIESDQMQAGNQAEAVSAHLPMYTHTIWRELPDAYALDPTFPTAHEVLTEMNNLYGLYSWFGHGAPTNVTTMSRRYNEQPRWCIDAQDAVELPTAQVLENQDALDNLTNFNHPSIVYSISCDITPFDDYRTAAGTYNMGEGFTINTQAGGPALLGNTRYGWVLTSYQLYQAFADQIAAGNTNLGVAELISKANYVVHYLEYSHNFVGCPETELWTAIPSEFNNVTITDGGSYVTVNAGVPGALNTICACSVDGGETYWRVAHNVVQYTFNTSVRPLYITITRQNFLPYIGMAGGVLNSTIAISGKLNLIGELSGTDKARIAVKKGSKIFLQDGVSREFNEELILEGEKINELSSLIKNNIENRIVNEFCKEIPDNYKLIGNYPNPFNPSTTVEYALPSESNVELSIFNLMGEKIKTIKLNNQSPGYHSIIWYGVNSDGVKVSSGVYFYTIRIYSTGDMPHEFIASSKMVLIK